ncbi:atexp12,atexpa12,athexp alpha 1.24,exp12,expa12 [Sarracenia purpurea var. burkii]
MKGQSNFNMVAISNVGGSGDVTAAWIRGSTAGTGALIGRPEKIFEPKRCLSNSRWSMEKPWNSPMSSLRLGNSDRPFLPGISSSS